MQQLPKAPLPPVPLALRWMLGAVIAANLLALWTVPWLPMADLGLHVQLLDIAARYNDVQTGYRSWFVLPHPLDPGTLPLWFARILPFFDAWALARLLLSAYIIGLPLSLLALARALGRSPWLALFAAPLTWNALVNAGLLHVLLALPLLFWALALARTMATEGGVRRGVQLAVTLVLLFFCHFLLFGLSVVSVVFLFVWYRQDVWSLSRLWVVLPTAPLLVQLGWRQLVAAQSAALQHVRAHESPATMVHLPLRALIDRLYDWTLLYFTDHVDYLLAAALLVVWVALWAVGEYDVASTSRGLLDAKSFERRMFGRRKWTWVRFKRSIADGSLLAGTFDRRRLRWANVQAWLTEHGLQALTLLWALLYLLLPTQFEGIPVVAELLPLPTLLLFALWPRVQFTGWRVWLAGLLLAMSLGYSWQVRAEFNDFAQTEVADLPAQLVDLPYGARFAAVMWQRESRVAYKKPLQHLPAGIVAARRGGLMDDNPATSPAPLLRFRKGLRSAQLQRNFWLDPALMEVDFVLLRSAAEPLDAQKSPRLEHMWHGGPWWLFRVVHGDRGRVKVVTAGGCGGLAGYDDCRRGSLLQGMTVQTGASAIQSVVPLCQDLANVKTATAPPDQGGRLGTPQVGAVESQLLCPRGQYVVSLNGRATEYIKAVQVQCSPVPWPAAQFSLTPTRVVGRGDGRDFDVHCPEGAVAVGLQGRFGDVADQIGLACAELATW